MYFNQPPDTLTVVPSPRSSFQQAASTLIAALEQKTRLAPVPRMQALRKVAHTHAPPPPSVVPDEALKRPASKSTRRRCSPRRALSPEPEPEKPEVDEATAVAAAIKAAKEAAAAKPRPTPPPAAATASGPSNLVDPTSLMPARPPTAYDQLKHLTRRINGVFMRYERGPTLYGADFDPDAPAEIEESPLFLKNTLDELLSASEKAALERKVRANACKQALDMCMLACH